jgi:hypothetical protein
VEACKRTQQNAETQGFIPQKAAFNPGRRAHGIHKQITSGKCHLLLFYIFVIHSIFWLFLSVSISAKLVNNDHTIHSSLSLSPYLSTLVALQIAADSNVVKQKLFFTNIASVYADLLLLLLLSRV